jgi:GH35 family endo-1,4-beta-xylanase
VEISKDALRLLNEVDSLAKHETESRVSDERLSRRQYIKHTGALVAGAAVGAAATYCGLREPSPATQTVIQTLTESITQTVTETVTEIPSCTASLRAAAENRGLLIGSETAPAELSNSRYANTLAREFNYLTPGVDMKWRRVHPSENEWYFASADRIVKFASDHQMKVKGHCLIWHYPSELPSYLTYAMPAEEVRKAIENHITTLVGRYRGKIHAWDVVNEAVDDNEGLRKSFFLNKLGEGYIGEAFHVAHEADSNALLIYNDYGAEGLCDKSDRVYSLVKKLIGDGVPIDEVGLQMHLSAWNYPKPEDVAANVRRLAQLGLKVNISEMDVEIKKVPGDLPERLEAQRRVYHDVIAACLKERNFTDITFWGFTDAYSWIDEWYGPDDPLLFDEEYQPKPAYWGVMDALLGE